MTPTKYSVFSQSGDFVGIGCPQKIILGIWSLGAIAMDIPWYSYPDQELGTKEFFAYIDLG